jgi:hypothetical protein
MCLLHKEKIIYNEPSLTGKNEKLFFSEEESFIGWATGVQLHHFIPTLIYSGALDKISVKNLEPSEPHLVCTLWR